MKLNFRLPSIFAVATPEESTEDPLLSLHDQPEAAAYFDLTCTEPICESINDSLVKYGEYAAH